MKRLLSIRALKCPGTRYALSLLAAGVVLAACSSSSPTSVNTKPTSGGSGATSAALASAKAAVIAHEAVPVFKAPGPAFDAKAAAKGKLVYLIPLSSSIPFEQAIDATEAHIAKQVGLRFVDWVNQGQVSQWSQGVDAAIAAHANAIILSGAPNPADLGPQLRKARAAGIKVFLAHDLPAGAPAPANVDYNIGTNYALAGQLEADYITWKSGGHAKVLLIESNDVLSSRPYATAVQKEFASKCVGCNLTVINVPTTLWATNLQSQVTSELQRNPGIQWVLPLFDGETQWVLPGIKAASDANRVHEVSYNATPFVLKDIQQGNIVSMDVGDQAAWNAYTHMDDVLRVLAGKPFVSNELLPERVFIQANAASAAGPNGGFGTSFVKGYDRLWGIGS